MQTINSKTALLGLVGFPLKHSFSPQIHNYIFKKLKINASYVCFEVAQGTFKRAIEGLYALGVVGLNITIPYKEKIIPYLDKVDRTASIIGAVNTVKVERGKCYGFNTDASGFRDSLKRQRISLRGMRVVIIGAGGAAKSVATVAAQDRAKSIILHDCIEQKATSLARRLRSNFPAFKVKVARTQEDIHLQDAQLLVNATGVGLKASDRCVCSFDGAPRDLVVYDLIYNPLMPRLLREARKQKLTTINGLWMLIYQALAAQRIWFNVKQEQFDTILYRKLSKVVQ